jgi:hypothetical protein
VCGVYRLFGGRTPAEPGDTIGHRVRSGSSANERIRAKSFC